MRLALTCDRSRFGDPELHIWIRDRRDRRVCIRTLLVVTWGRYFVRPRIDRHSLALGRLWVEWPGILERWQWPPVEETHD